MADVRRSSNFGNEFEKQFDFLCRSRSRWNVWSDFVHIAAYSISNAVDSVHREKREAEYLKIVERYSAVELESFARMFALAVEALDADAEQDFLGELYMRLELRNARNGQFFSPYNICRLMADMQMESAIDTVEKNGYTTVCDCCVGGGAMLVAFANACLMEGIDYHNKVLFVGQDVDHTVAMMAYIQLSLLGCPGYIVVGNSLTEPLTGDPLYAPMDRETFITPFYCSDVWNARRIWHGLDSLFTATDADRKQAV